MRLPKPESRGVSRRNDAQIHLALADHEVCFNQVVQKCGYPEKLEIPFREQSAEMSMDSFNVPGRVAKFVDCVLHGIQCNMVHNAIAPSVQDSGRAS